ncbi:MAG: NAD-binding protein [Nanoarchaeota archaeon]
MKIIIVGGGETGLTTANLLAKDHDITLIESDEKRAKDLASKTEALVVLGDGVDLSILKEAGIKKADAIVAVTNDDKTNLMICQIAKSEKVSKIISLVRSPGNDELFTKLGITSIVSSVGTSVAAIKRLLYQWGDERIIAALGKGDVQIIQQTMSKDSKLIGKKAEIKNAVVATIYRSGDLIIPKKGTILEEGDVLLVAVKTKQLQEVLNVITGK